MDGPDVDYDGEIARTYAQGRSLSKAALETWYQAVAPLIPPDGPVVDVGAGTGRFSHPLAALASGRVIAVEPASGMRPTPDGAGEAVSWVGATAEELPLNAGSVGLVWSAFTAHYLDLQRAGVEFTRVLKPGGRVVIWHAFPDVFDDLEWFRWFPTARALDEQRIPGAAAVRRGLEAGGLELSGRSEHRMWIADDLGALADRLAHRSISTLRLIPDDQFDAGLSKLRAAVETQGPTDPVFATNVMLTFVKR